MADGGEAEVIDMWLRLLDAKVPEERRGDVAVVALQFAELAGCRIAWNRTWEGRNMIESMVYKEIMQRGGEIAKVQIKRDDLLFLVQEKFRAAVSETYLKLIRDQDSFEVLDGWYRAAVRLDKAEDFFAVMRR